MYKQLDMLETIYEVDEEKTLDCDCSTFDVRRSQFSRYFCLCMLIGCFLTIPLIIAVSFHPFCLSTHSKSLPLNADEKAQLSTRIINHLSPFARQINEQLGLSPNTITFFTSSDSYSLLDTANQSSVLWLYGRTEYPQSCLYNIRCKENLQSKLRITFNKLANFLTTMDLSAYYKTQIQLDWCDLIENSTAATFVSLLSLRSMNFSVLEGGATTDQNICENIDQIVLVSRIIENNIQQEDSIKSIPGNLDGEKTTSRTDLNSNSQQTEGEVNTSCANRAQCSTYSDHSNNQETTDRSNDIKASFRLLYDLF